MNIAFKDLNKVLMALNNELAGKNILRELITCGGGALVIMGVSSRETRDLDVISPQIDSQLLECSHSVAKAFGLDKNWLNNGPSGFCTDLEKGWELRAVVSFCDSNLIVKTLGRRDLLATKLQGLCDRDEYDLEDILSLKPTEIEIESLKNWLLGQDASIYWPKRVTLQIQKLIARIRNEQ